MSKIEFSTDKMSWHPSPLAGQIVLLTTINQEGVVDVAPKSWVTMMSFNPPIIVVGCNRKHTTASNLTKKPEFVINIPSEDLATQIYDMPRIPSPRSPERLGLTPEPSMVVTPPGIAECFAHLECRLIKVEGIGSGEEIIIFGEILKARINGSARQGSHINRYSDLRPIFFLEDGAYGVVDVARTVGEGFTNLGCVVVTLKDVGDVSSSISEHIVYLKGLQRNGLLGGILRPISAY